ncbi:hypothetical protein AYC66_00450 [Elizabethkingia anophelis]|uniref:Special sigma factor n=2 Tax=Elizabethkingia anophelis TaxID=1117645 RepID=A0A494J4N5_9FLAO|nr:hypothetical protein AYC66_00450 [Elizabethkingia anophelis]OPB48980.1 hypothetical protein BAY09_02780 [Elizabethkingia anophelis]
MISLHPLLGLLLRRKRKNSIEFLIRKTQNMNQDFLKDLEKWNNQSQEKVVQKIEVFSEAISIEKENENPEFLTERLNLRLTKAEHKMLKEKSELSNIGMGKLIRIAVQKVQGFKIIIPNAEENKTLLEYRTNFSRIRNHFQSQMWSEDEREKYKSLLDEIIFKIDKYLQKK